MRRFAGFIPGIVIALASAGLTVGFAHPNFELARLLFLFAGALIMAKPIYDAFKSRSLKTRQLGWLISAGAMGICVAAGGWIWVGNQQAQAQTSPPSVSGNCNNFGNNNTNCNVLNVRPADRHLTDGLKKQLLDGLPKSRKITIFALSAESDAQPLADEIYSFLNGEGYSVERPSVGMLFGDKPEKGIQVELHNDHPDRPVQIIVGFR